MEESWLEEFFNLYLNMDEKLEEDYSLKKFLCNIDYTNY